MEHGAKQNVFHLTFFEKVRHDPEVNADGTILRLGMVLSDQGPNVLCHERDGWRFAATISDIIDCRTWAGSGR